MIADRLVHDPDAIAALSAAVAEQTSVPAEHVEKDFWVTEVLRGVVAAAERLGVEVVFKGGTSLSKGFSLIQRFSEDVDVLVVLSPQDSAGARDRTLKELVAGASKATTLEAIGVPGAISKGIKRGARFHYRPDVTASVGRLSAGCSLSSVHVAAPSQPPRVPSRPL